MRSVLVVVGHELAENRQQVVLVKDDHMVQALSAERPNNAFGDRIRLWRVNRGADGVNPDPAADGVACGPRASPR